MADPNLRNEGAKQFFTSRGCPYSCTYCFNKEYNRLYAKRGRIMRFRTPEDVVAEIEAARERYPLSKIIIDDDAFLPKPKGWLEHFSEIYRQRIGLPLDCNARANVIDDRVAGLLKEAGVTSIWLGIETGNEEIANRVLLRNLSSEQLFRAGTVIKKYGIRLVTYNLAGLPVPEPYRTDLVTLDFNIRLQPDFALCSVLYPYPGTAIERYSRREGFLQGEVPFMETNKRVSVLSYDDPMEKRRVENIHKLMGIIVRFPFLRRWCDLLCNLPLTWLYASVFYLWYGYNIKFKIYPFRSKRRELAKYMGLWWGFSRKK